MIVYLAGPINGCTDDEANDWREKFIDLLADQMDVFGVLDPMRRDYRGEEDGSVDEIVDGDKEDIRHCDIFLAYCWQPSWGTAMEMFYAHILGRLIILIMPDGVKVSPWLRYHADHIVRTLDEAAELIRGL